MAVEHGGELFFCGVVEEVEGERQFVVTVYRFEMEIFMPLSEKQSFRFVSRSYGSQADLFPPPSLAELPLHSSQVYPYACEPLRTLALQRCELELLRSHPKDEMREGV